MRRAEKIVTNFINRLSGTTDRATETRSFIDKHVKMGDEARAVLHEAYQHIFTVSLAEFAAQQGKDPKDYSLRQVSARSNEDSDLMAEAEVLKDLRDQMNEEGFLAIVGFQLQSTPIAREFDKDDLLTIARGTAVKLSAPQTS